MARTGAAVRWTVPASEGPGAGRVVQALQDLVRSGPGDVDVAWQHRQTLVGAAVTLTAAAGHDPDLGTCASAGCELASIDHDPDVCAIADRLSRVDGGPRGTVELPVDVALAAFTEALTAAADAILHCRQHVHAGSGCWFSPVPGVDGCGDVLRLLHRCG